MVVGLGLGWVGTDYSGAADRLQYTNYMICTRVKGSCATLNPSLKKLVSIDVKYIFAIESRSELVTSTVGTLDLTWLETVVVT